jgi:hypothetical protein
VQAVDGVNEDSPARPRDSREFPYGDLRLHEVLEYHVRADEVEARVLKWQLIESRCAHRAWITPLRQREQVNIAPDEHDSSFLEPLELIASPFGQ